MSIIDMVISRTKVTKKKYLYTVHHMGEVVVANSGDPEHDACRAYEGPATHIQFKWSDGVSGLLMPVAWGKAHYTKETENFGPATKKWKPHPRGLGETKEPESEGGR